jgi:phosphatidylglycerol:prolipoprotein diacylglycerol transferase
LEVLRFWGAMSSYGGIAGGLLGAFALMKWRGMSRSEMLGLADCIGFAFPFAWIFGRLGCALSHDHLGVSSTHWLAVRFPDGPRFDLGLLEFFYTLVIAAVFWALARRRRPHGFFPALFFCVYGPARFAMDALRTGEARYFGWTPGQYASVAATLLGAGALFLVLRRRPDAQAPSSGIEA